MRVLLVGKFYQCAWMLPELLARAGFSVDVITCSPLMRSSKYVQQCFVVKDSESAAILAFEQRGPNYDWIIITDDSLLKEISKSSRTNEDKLRLLPILREENLGHIYSRIGFAKTLFQNNISTPDFRIVNSLSDALVAGREIGYPVLLKTDSSGGGSGIFACHSEEDIYQYTFHEPLLMQKQIMGRELDLSALYFEGNLIHFNHAEVKEVIYEYGPSRLRKYTPLSLVDKAFFEELSALGKALGAHGFVSISCLESHEGRFYIEADMRPNVWVDFPRFVGEDLATRISNWFEKKETLSYPVKGPLGSSPLVLPYFLRLERWEILLNRYHVWRFIKGEDKFLIRKVLFEHMRPQISLSRFPFVKSLTPSKIKKKWQKLKNIFQEAI